MKVRIAEEMVSEGNSASSLDTLTDTLTGSPEKDHVSNSSGSFVKQACEEVEEKIRKYMSSASSSGSLSRAALLIRNR